MDGSDEAPRANHGPVAYPYEGDVCDESSVGRTGSQSGRKPAGAPLDAGYPIKRGVDQNRQQTVLLPDGKNKKKIARVLSTAPLPPPGYILYIDADPIPDPEVAPKRRFEWWPDVRMLPNMANNLGDEFVGLCHQAAQRRVLGYILVIELLAQAFGADQMRIDNRDTDGTGSAGGSGMDEQYKTVVGHEARRRENWAGRWVARM